MVRLRRRRAVDRRRGGPPLPVFVSDVTLAASVTSAVWTVAGVGLYTPLVNGRPVSAAVLQPGYTDYSKRVEYRSYDVTALMGQGANRLTMQLGTGMYDSMNLADRYSKLRTRPATRWPWCSASRRTRARCVPPCSALSGPPVGTSTSARSDFRSPSEHCPRWAEMTWCTTPSSRATKRGLPISPRPTRGGGAACRSTGKAVSYTHLTL